MLFCDILLTKNTDIWTKFEAKIPGKGKKKMLRIRVNLIEARKSALGQQMVLRQPNMPPFTRHVRKVEENLWQGTLPEEKLLNTATAPRVRIAKINGTKFCEFLVV